MRKVTGIKSRKAEHIQINLDEDVHSGLSHGLEGLSLEHQALPELSLASVSTTLELYERHLQAPLIISSMTGGTPQAGLINRRLAEAAQQSGIALGLGSFRVALDQPQVIETFQVRKYAPDVLLFANLGAIQLNYGIGLEQCQRAVDACEADALILHLNPLQEALQPGGDTDFSGLSEKIKAICRHLPVPVIAKEVGWGISVKTAHRLVDCGVSAIDVAGAGGTSWSQVEMYRADDPLAAEVASAFRFWGIPTARAIRSIRRAFPRLTLFASGGLKNGVEIAKCIALGANLAAMAAPFLKPAVESSEAVFKVIETIIRQLRIAMFSCSATDLKALARTPIHPLHSADSD